MNKPQPKKPVDRLHHITRVDNETKNTHGWCVTVVRNKQRTDKQFSDPVHGGKHNCLQVAIKYRDELLKETDMAELLIGYRTNLRSDNKSGVAGVSRRERFNKGYPNSGCLYWISRGFNEYGLNSTRYFSIPRYGEDIARQMAIDERERQVKRVCDIQASKKSVHTFRCKKK